MSLPSWSLAAAARASVKYSYDPQFGFQGAKTYRWAESGSPYGWDPLLEANVRFLSDRLLEAKGLTRTDQPALRVSIRYESSGYSYELRALSLNVFRADTNQLVWRGVATGTIRSDAAYSDLSAAVQASWAIFPRQSRIHGPLTRLPLSHLFGGLFLLVARCTPTPEGRCRSLNGGFNRFL